MNFRPSPSWKRLLACLAVFALLGPSCKGKVNQSQAKLLTTVRVSLSSGNKQGDAEAVPFRGDISDDGRYVVFASKATNLVPSLPDLNSASDVFLRDNVLRTTTLVSVNNAGTAAANGASTQPSISGDGRFVVFASTADNLTPEDADAVQDIFIRDMQNPNPLTATRLVSRASGPNSATPTAAKANQASTAPRISKNGRFVVWQTSASNLDGADVDVFKDVYRRDVNDPGGVAFATILVSRPTGNGAKATNESTNPSISRDGHIVAFESIAVNMVTSTADGGPKVSANRDIFVRDCNALTTIRVSLSKSFPANPDPDGASGNPCVSGDGNFVAFQSGAANLVPEDDGILSDIFLRDIPNSRTEILSVHSSGAQAGQGCDFPSVNEDGTIVVFDSPSSNLVNGDSNGVRDIFVRMRVSKQTLRISVATFGEELNGDSRYPAISADGRYILFHSQASNAADDDVNGAGDFYLRGPPF